MLIIARTTGV